MAKDKLFPAIFMRLNTKGVPVLGVVISSVFVSILMSMNYTKGLVEQFKFLMLNTFELFRIVFMPEKDGK